MTRLIPFLCLLASTAMANWPPRSIYLPRLHQARYQPPQKDLTRVRIPEINERMKELYNARDFTTLVKELYHEYAVLHITKYGIEAEGHHQIETLLRNTAFGKIDEIKIVEVRFVKGILYVDAIMTYSYADGRKLQSHLVETIQKGKFNSVIQSHIE